MSEWHLKADSLRIDDIDGADGFVVLFPPPANEGVLLTAPKATYPLYGGVIAIGASVNSGEPVFANEFGILEIETGGGGSSRFGIEDNTGVQDRLVDMAGFLFQMANAGNLSIGNDSSITGVDLSVNFGSNNQLQVTSSQGTKFNGLVSRNDHVTLYGSDSSTGKQANAYFYSNGTVDINAIGSGPNYGNIYLTQNEIGIIAPAFYFSQQGASTGEGYALIDVAGDGYLSLQPLVGGDYVDDSAAAVGGISVGGLYHTAGAVKVRLS